MRWPWDDRHGPVVEPPGETGAPATVSPAGWASLPPLTGQVTPFTPTADLSSFPGRGSAWSNPALTRPLQRQVATGMPVLFPASPPTGGSPRATSTPELTVVARAAAGGSTRTARDAGPAPTRESRSESVPFESTGQPGHSMTTSVDHLPVLTLPTEPLPDPASEPGGEPESEPQAHATAPLPELVPLQTSAAPAEPMDRAEAEPSARTAIQPVATGEVTEPRVPLPLAVQRTETSPTTSTATEVPIPDRGYAVEAAASVAPAGTPPEPSSANDAGRSAHEVPLQRSTTSHLASLTGLRAGLGAPLRPSTPATQTPPPLPVAQRSAASVPTPTVPASAEPRAVIPAPPGSGPDADHTPHLPPLAPGSPAPPRPDEPTQEHLATPPVDLPDRIAGSDNSDGSDGVRGSDGDGASDTTEPVVAEPPGTPPAVPLTLSRSVADLVPDVVAAQPEPPAPADLSGQPTEPRAAHDPSPMWDPPSPEHGGDSARDRDSAPAQTSDGPSTRPDPPATTSRPPLPLVARDTMGNPDIVVARSTDSGAGLRPPGPAGRPADIREPQSRSGTGSNWNHVNQPELALPGVQRATRTALTPVVPEPPPTLQRLPGLSSLPGMVRDRPALPRSAPWPPQAPIQMPAGTPGSLTSMPPLPSLPADLPSAQDAPGVSALPEPAAPAMPMPMPVATARALVAAVTGGPRADGATSAPADGIPATPPPVASPDEAAPPATSAAGTDIGAAPPVGAAPAGATAAAGGAPGAASSPQQLDELARRLYDPLASRLRAELLLDRERRGLRTDAW